MSSGGPPSHGIPGDPSEIGISEVQVLPLHKEDVAVSKRVRKTLVRASRTTTTRDIAVEEDLRHDHVVVERVAIGRIVDAVSPIRQEGDVTILSVVEEIVVVERRLMLKEEVRLRRVQTTGRHVETVTLREQGVTVTRTDIRD
jgi:stress response protein YsnF